jgi:hypothetical protein
MSLASMASGMVVRRASIVDGGCCHSGLKYFVWMESCAYRPITGREALEVLAHVELVVGRWVSDEASVCRLQ